MHPKRIFLAIATVVTGITLVAQTPAPVNFTADQDHQNMMEGSTPGAERGRKGA